MAKIRILVADDHALVREGITAILRLHDDLEVVAEAADGKETIRKAFSRYISPRLADRIIADAGAGNDLFGTAQRAHVVALFADLRGFTRLTESNEVGAVVAMSTKSNSGCAAKSSAASV